jgi:tetratricopeptide (TPR) repeat protein
MSDPLLFNTQHQPAAHGDGATDPSSTSLPPFLDVPLLLESSRPRGQHRWILPALLAFVVLVLGSAYLSSRSSEWNAAIRALSSGLMVLIAIVMGSLMWSAVRGQRDERRHLEAVEELVQLRRWPQAAALLDFMLSQPARTPGGRVQALMFLSGVLARYNRFDDAIAVQNHLLETVELDPSTRYALRLGRAMAMLREDHLFDADRAINELRRDVSRAVDAASRRNVEDENEPAPESSTASPDATPAPVSAGLALIEIYRDVKTGHAAEAVESFHKVLPALRQQLGHRVADAHALVARAYDLLGKADEAMRHWQNATLLSPPSELHRRYPELRALSERYPASLAPAEAA